MWTDMTFQKTISSGRNVGFPGNLYRPFLIISWASLITLGSMMKNEILQSSTDLNRRDFFKFSAWALQTESRRKKKVVHLNLTHGLPACLEFPFRIFPLWFPKRFGLASQKVGVFGKVSSLSSFCVATTWRLNKPCVQGVETVQHTCVQR